jgi:hypothetical protein
MRTVEHSVDALEFVVGDMLELMLRANEKGFSALEVFQAMDFVIRQAQISISEERGYIISLEIEDTPSAPDHNTPSLH